MSLVLAALVLTPQPASAQQTVKQGSAPDVSEIDAILDTLRENGAFKRLMEP